MTREEFKREVADFIDNLIDTDRELSDTDEDNLSDQFGQLATDILQEEDDK